MIVVTMFILIKTFFFLRMFKELSFLVTMLTHVFEDLKVYLIFYVIMIFQFSMFFTILDLGNFRFSDDPVMRAVPNTITAPDKEYYKLSRALSHMIIAFRMSFGDFDFGSSTYMDALPNTLYFISWLLILTVFCIVFLNFIIAEVSNSYQNVKDSLETTILQERGTLINESEDMLRARFGQEIATWEHFFPKYLITRELDD